MNRTDAFANDFCKKLNDSRSAQYTWVAGGRPIGRGHESVDIVGWPKRRGARLVLVEVELRKDAPLTNVVKIWRWVADKEFRRRFVLIQAFSRYYKEGDTKRKNAEFIGRCLEKATGNTYVSVSFGYNPYRHGKQGAGRRQRHARLLASKIRRNLRALR